MGDNIDKRVKPSRQRAELNGLDLHYFHGYAVRDRLDMSKMSDKAPEYVPPDPAKFIPSSEEIVSVAGNFSGEVQ